MVLLIRILYITWCTINGTLVGGCKTLQLKAVCNGAHIDNLCLKYGDCHGVGSGTNEGLTITNCEFGWIGGSIQGESIFGRNHPTRFGNAVEIYGGCDGYSGF